MYVTHDGGQTCDLTFVNAEPTAFYDCMSFFDASAGWRSPTRLTAFTSA